MKTGKKNKKPADEQNSRVLGVCKLLNDAKARYILIGGVACNLLGLIRATNDIDILIPADVRNTESILTALQGLTFGISSELDAKDVAAKPITIIGDVPRVDLLTVAGKVKYEQAAKTSKHAKINGIKVVYADLETLIKTKDTDRLQDKADVERLRAIRKK